MTVFNTEKLSAILIFCVCLCMFALVTILCVTCRYIRYQPKLSGYESFDSSLVKPLLCYPQEQLET